MYAVVDIKGKQYKAEKGTLLKVDHLDGAEGDEVSFDQVMLLSDGEKVQVGTPFVKGAVVKTKLEKHGKGEKVVVLKYRKRKGSRKKRGHRQHYSFVRVEEIVGA